MHALGNEQPWICLLVGYTAALVAIRPAKVPFGVSAIQQREWPYSQQVTIRSLVDVAKLSLKGT
jgi:hypothetical protein